MRSSLKNVYWFHGHICPMSTLGYRAGMVAKKLLKLNRTDYHNALCKLYFRSCAIDGVQLSFPATYGNGNLIVFDEKEMRFEFSKRSSKKTISLTFTKKLQEVMNEFLSIREKCNNSDDKKLQEELAEKYNFFLRFAQQGKVTDIFNITLI